MNIDARVKVDAQVNSVFLGEQYQMNSVLSGEQYPVNSVSGEQYTLNSILVEIHVQVCYLT
jgi:hypothetical protein